MLACQRSPETSQAGWRDHRGIQKKNFLRTLAAHLEGVAHRKPVEIWFQDEARIGQKNGRVCQWRGAEPAPRNPPISATRAPISSAHLPGTRRRRGPGTAFADTDAMQLHLDEISRMVARGVNAVLLLDRAGWHTTANLNVPKNITLIFLPSRSPELNPVEQIWQYIRANWLSNRVFDTYDEIIDAACDAWNRLVAQPHTITSIGMRHWAYSGHP
ncbi:MAG TPA: transposase [Hyphomicrobiaceae bacterium]|nr:transposase [Hyphomicrobiaceae bacterium]